MMQRHIISFLLLLSAIIGVPNSGMAQDSTPGKSNYDIGVQAFRNNDYQRAFDAWSLGAYEENAEAQYNLGVLYLEGRGVERNVEQARSWFIRAAEKNQREAQYNLGHMALSGIGIEKNVNEALKWWQRASDGGYPEAQYNYGRALYLGIGARKDIPEGLRLIRLAAKQKDQRAKTFLAKSADEIAVYDRALAEVDTATGDKKSVPAPAPAPTLKADTKKQESAPDSTPKEPELAVSQQAAKKVAVAPVKERTRDVLSTANQVIALEAEEKPARYEEPKMSRKAAKAALYRQVPEREPTAKPKSKAALEPAPKPKVKAKAKPKPKPKAIPTPSPDDNRVVALDPLPQDTQPLEKAEFDLVIPGAAPLPTKQDSLPDDNRVIALDDPAPALPAKQKLLPKPEVLEVPVIRKTGRPGDIDNQVIVVQASSSVAPDQFLRTVDQPINVYAQSGLSEILDTLVPKTVVKLINREADRVQIQVAAGLPAWVRRVEVQLRDGYASPTQNSVALLTRPDGRVIGELPHLPHSLVIEQRRKWLKLRVSQSIYGWIEAQALETSGESEEQLIVDWVRESHAVSGAKKWPNTRANQQAAQADITRKAPVSVLRNYEGNRGENRVVNQEVIALKSTQPPKPAAPIQQTNSVIALDVEKPAELAFTPAPDPVTRPESVKIASKPVANPLNSDSNFEIDDNAWLFSQPEDAWSIHLFTVLDHQKALDITQDIRNSDRYPAEVHFYTTRAKGKDWSFVLLGVYPDDQAAQAALDALPKGASKGSRVRKIALIASNRCAKRDDLSNTQQKGLNKLCP